MSPVLSAQTVIDPTQQTNGQSTGNDTTTDTYDQTAPYGQNDDNQPAYNQPMDTTGQTNGNAGNSGYGNGQNTPYSNQGPANGSATTSSTQRTNLQNNQTRTATEQGQNRASIYAPPQPLTEFQKIVAESTGKVLPIFGADLFNVPPSTFAPVENIPVTPDYVIGPGDELRILIWGQVNQRGSFFVDRTGSIAIPQVGTVHVAGLRFSQLTDFLKSQLSRVYRNYDLNVNLGQLRSIQVFVVGKARRPGSYTIGSLSTLLNALFASGGPQPLGSLRDIQLRRNGETITHFDLYDLLLHGDKSKDVPLASGDVIFIPDVGPQVAVAGSVKSPGIYELHGETSFAQVVALAGGETNVAAGTEARIERIADHSERSEIQVNLKNPAAPPVQDGDVIILNSIVDRFNDAVTLRGNVANPGRYAWRPGMRILDLIPNRESLVTRDYYRRHNQLGQLIPITPETAPVTQLSQQQQLLLQQQQQLLQQQQLQQQQQQTSPLTQTPTQTTQRTTTSTDRPIGGGAAAAGNALTLSNQSFPVKNDVVLSAPDIDWDYAVIERQNPKTLTTSLVPFNLGKLVLDNDQSQNLELMPGDVVVIFSKADIRVPSEHQTKFVKLEGEFAAAGTYSVEPGEKLQHLLERAGGFTPNAYLFASEFTRESVRQFQKQRLNEYADSLESQIATETSALLSSVTSDRDTAAAEATQAQGRAALDRLRQLQPSGRIVLQVKPDSRGISAVPDLELEDGDRFIVPKIPSTVSVVGQVYSSNAFVFEPGRKVRDYLHLAGGPDRESDMNRAFILRADGSVVSHQYTSARHFGNFDQLAILPGDTIVVPPKLVRGAALRELSNIATILQGFGIAAAAVEVLK